MCTDSPLTSTATVNVTVNGLNDQPIAANDDWKSTQQTAIAATGLAPLNDMESAAMLTLQPGAYTVIVRGKGAATGVGIVETFLVN